MFTDKAGKAQRIEYRIVMPPGCLAQERWRWMPRHLYGPVKNELEEIAKKGIIEESPSPWQSLLVIVPKPDGTTEVYIEPKIYEI